MTGTAEGIPEPELNALLRGVDWRFLLATPARPRALDRGSGVDPRALRLIADDPGGAPDLVLTGFPRRRALAEAARDLPPGGEVACLWRLPRPAGASLARRRLERAGFLSVRVHWPGPVPGRPPQFWLPADSATARRRLLAERPAAGPAGSLLRAAWRLASRAGMLAPLCAVGRLPGAAAEPELAAGVRATLLTGGRRSINKVVEVAAAGGAEEGPVTKLARVPAAGEALDREAAALDRVAAEHPGMEGVPRLLGTGERAGCRAVRETAVGGREVIAGLSRAAAPALCAEVGEWLLGLVSRSGPVGPERWRARLVDGPLERLRDGFEAAQPGVAGRCAAILAGLGPLPAAAEHRDCSPWNVLRRPGGGLGLLDWESAEPDGLPLLDLVYFAANASFVLDGALESGSPRPTYARLLDRAEPEGRGFADCLSAYAGRTGVAAADVPRLRLLCWVVHAHSDRRHLEMAAAGDPSPEALRGSPFLSLIGEELARQGRTT